MNFAVIIQNNNISQWQKNCLEYLCKKKKFNLKLILNCQNKAKKTFKFQNIFYYIINFFCLHNKFTKKINFDTVKKLNFDTIESKKKSWTSLPKSLIDKIKENKIDFVIKFGLDLLYIEEYYKDLKIISFHHGDPQTYRGRPAGFYEIFNNENYVGISLQVLNNNLDAGNFLSVYKSKIYNYSYKKTAEYFYDLSKYVLDKGLENLRKNRYIEIQNYGKNYKLPSNFLCFKFLCKLLFNKTNRVIYGLFFEKKWNIGKNKNFSKILFKNGLISIENSAKIPSDYHFFADPHISNQTKFVRVEGIKNYEAKGKIILLDENLKFREILLEDKKHFSYPYSFIENNEEYIMPEVASHSKPFLLNSKDLKKKIFIEFEKDIKLLDATLFKNNQTYYIFGTCKNNDLLYLFHSNNLFNKFYEHKKSPINLGPYGSRMGGGIFKINGKLFRFGQNNLTKYGSSLILYEITTININEYCEKFVKEFKVKNFLGPHTFSINDNDEFYYDFYYEKFSVFSGIRRLIDRL